MKILLVDDDIDALDITSYALQREGHKVVVARDGAQAIRRWKSDQPDMVLLDIGLPNMNGIEVCRTIREQSTTPVILLTGLTDEEQIIRGYQSGADDYITKPFSSRVLEARIQAVFARSAGRGDLEPSRELTIGALSIDVDSHEVWCEDDMVTRLTPIEFRLIYILAMNAPRVISNQRLVDYAWSYSGGDISLLKTHMSHIRTKLMLREHANADILSIPGVGYRLAAAADIVDQKAS